MDWPPVTVLLVTYNRPAEIRRTLTALQTHLRYPGLLTWHLADDHSPDAYIPALLQDFPHLHFTVSDGARGGWGHNVNLALRACPHDYIFLCEDDYVCRRDLDLGRGVALLGADETMGAVRYDGLAGHALDLLLREAQTPLGSISHLRVLKSSPHLNVYSNRPHLRHVRFHQLYGYYPEGKRLGTTEEMYAHIVKGTAGPDVVALDDGIAPAFDHIGVSWQLSANDQELVP